MPEGEERRARVPRVGLDAYSLTGPSGHEICDRDVFRLLRKTKELGADGLQAALPDDAAAIRDAFGLAAELDLYLEPYVHLPLHWQGDTAVIERRERKFHLTCQIAAEHGVRALHCTMGARERFQAPGRWKEFVAATAPTLRRLAPVLRERGMRIGLENHWDYTTYEIVQIAEQVGGDVVGVGLDTGNLPILGEAPERAIARAAPWTATTHLKDVYLFSTAHGAARPIVGLGEGQMGIANAVAAIAKHQPAINFTIEDHPVIYPVEYFEPWWLDALPELTTHDIAELARLAREGDRWLAEHRVSDPHAAELVPWSIRGPARLAADVRAVQQMLRHVEATPPVGERGAAKA